MVTKDFYSFPNNLARDSVNVRSECILKLPLTPPLCPGRANIIHFEAHKLGGINHCPSSRMPKVDSKQDPRSRAGLPPSPPPIYAYLLDVAWESTYTLPGPVCVLRFWRGGKVLSVSCPGPLMDRVFDFSPHARDFQKGKHY
ncbi:hypothetical protein PM082_024069 [Marasmius tenuissimus]|nr:hypothetical protein PM082_024069 [Marasmius tenuissimus]